MLDVVSASTRRRRATAVVAGTLAAALTTVGVWSHLNRDEPGASVTAAGPLTIKAGDTELVFPRPTTTTGTTTWSAIAGGLLLCGPNADQVTITKVTPQNGDRAETFTAYTRAFTIQRRHDGWVGEPFIGAYGQPPWIGGRDNPHEDRLLGDIHPAAGSAVDPPRCEETTSAPGEAAVELMVGLTAGPEGSAIDGVTVDYDDAAGRHHQTHVAVRMTLCGTQITDSDCAT